MTESDLLKHLDEIAKIKFPSDHVHVNVMMSIDQFKERKLAFEKDAQFRLGFLKCFQFFKEYGLIQTETLNNETYIKENI